MFHIQLFYFIYVCDYKEVSKYANGPTPIIRFYQLNFVIIIVINIIVLLKQQWGLAIVNLSMIKNVNLLCIDQTLQL